MDLDYWQQQTTEKPLFPDIEWNKPERRDQAGKLGIIGGNRLGFLGVAEAYSVVLNTGIGEARVLLPNALKSSFPKTITGVVFTASTKSGGFAKDAYEDALALSGWGDGLLLIGDAGKNSETAILFEKILENYSGIVVISRDAIDLLLTTPEILLERSNTLLIASFAQLQKVFMSVYYPKVMTFNMQLTALIEAAHKFTITYPVTIGTFHQDNFIVASNGRVITTPFSNPMAIWRGETASKAACYYLWNSFRPLEATATSLIAQPL